MIEDATSSSISPTARRSTTARTRRTSSAGTSGPCRSAGGEPRQVTTGDGHRDVSGAARVGQDARDAQRDVEHAEVARRLVDRPRRRAEDRLSGRRVPASRWPRTSSRSSSSRSRPTTRSRFPISCSCRRTSSPARSGPAMIFVHGGPVRQMLLGYHYRYVYHQFYAVNEWLASHGYVVLSINYRSGVGYGRSFRSAPQHDGARQLRISGRRRRREVSAVAAGRRSEAHRHLRPVVRRPAHRAGARAQLGHLRARRRLRRRAPVRQLARSGRRCRISRRRFRRSTSGSRPC